MTERPPECPHGRMGMCGICEAAIDATIAWERKRLEVLESVAKAANEMLDAMTPAQYDETKKSTLLVGSLLALDQLGPRPGGRPMTGGPGDFIARHARCSMAPNEHGVMTITSHASGCENASESFDGSAVKRGTACPSMALTNPGRPCRLPEGHAGPHDFSRASDGWVTVSTRADLEELIGRGGPYLSVCLAAIENGQSVQFNVGPTAAEEWRRRRGVLASGHQGPSSAPLEARPEGCHVEPYSSRVCERGTMACTVKHGRPEATPVRCQWCEVRNAEVCAACSNERGAHERQMGRLDGLEIRVKAATPASELPPDDQRCLSQSNEGRQCVKWSLHEGRCTWEPISTMTTEDTRLLGEEGLEYDARRRSEAQGECFGREACDVAEAGLIKQRDDAWANLEEIRIHASGECRHTAEEHMQCFAAIERIAASDRPETPSNPFPCTWSSRIGYDCELHEGHQGSHVATDLDGKSKVGWTSDHRSAYRRPIARSRAAPEASPSAREQELLDELRIELTDIAGDLWECRRCGATIGIEHDTDQVPHAPTCILAQRSAAASPSEPVLCDACGKDLDAESTAAAENARCHRTLGCSRERDHGGDCTPMANQPGDPTIRHVVAWMRQTYPQNQHAREWANEIERVFLRGAAATPPKDWHALYLSAIRQLGAIAEALGNTNGDPEVSLGMVRELAHGPRFTDLHRVASRAVKSWEEDPTSVYTENAIRDLDHELTRDGAPEPCCYEAPAGIHSENCPTRADEASAPCRKCTECEGRHHWLETLAYVCKHCELLAEGCEDCDGTGGLDGDVDSDAPCATCNGDGVIVPDQRRAAAKNDGR